SAYLRRQGGTTGVTALAAHHLGALVFRHPGLHRRNFGHLMPVHRPHAFPCGPRQFLPTALAARWQQYFDPLYLLDRDQSAMVSRMARLSSRGAALAAARLLATACAFLPRQSVRGRGLGGVSGIALAGCQFPFQILDLALLLGNLSLLLGNRFVVLCNRSLALGDLLTQALIFPPGSFQLAR